MVHTLDLNFLDIDHAIASFLLESSEGPVLIETGPYSTFQVLEKRVESCGYQMKDIKHVLLTHIHFDHAGAAWALAKTGANIYVHPFGAGHMIDPTKLYDSAKRIYGDEMERLWGKMELIPENRIVSVDHQQEINIGEHTFTALHTPGHAKHHIAWKVNNMIFTGDVAGVKIGEGPVVPPCPPPDIDLEDWNNSVQLLLEQKVSSLYLTHFGVVKDIETHLAELREMLNDWAWWVKGEWESGKSPEEITPAFTKYTASQLKAKGVNEHGISQYEAANPSWMSVAGLIRYWKKRQSSD